MSVAIYVEGGGKGPDLRNRCRKAFQSALRGVSFARGKPKIVACGPRAEAYDKFCIHLKNSPTKPAVLLVDAESPIAVGSDVWEHVRTRAEDKWERPESASADHLHLMAVCMETWFLADPGAMEKHFGAQFKPHKLPGDRFESLSKERVFAALEVATAECKNPYEKASASKASFQILGLLELGEIRGKLHYCDRFLRRLEQS